MFIILIWEYGGRYEEKFFRKIFRTDGFNVHSSFYYIIGRRSNLILKY